MTSGVEHTVRSNGFGRAIWDVQLFVPNKVHTSITALIKAFHRAIAQFTWPRVWPRDPFGEGSCTSGYMLKWVANPSSDWE